MSMLVLMHHAQDAAQPGQVPIHKLDKKVYLFRTRFTLQPMLVPSLPQPQPPAFSEFLLFVFDAENASKAR